jgi:FemAB-related protein (PEP-CTERM system-associated)
MLVESWLFGKFLVSLPYLNSGGVLLQGGEGDTREHKDVGFALIDRAVELADALDVKYLELRHEVPWEHPAFNAKREDKVHMRMVLPGDPVTLLATYKSKLRSQLKKSGENNFELAFGGEELIEGFYQVFSENMRDLGTPVYGRALFQEILRRLDGSATGVGGAELCLVRLGGTAICGALLVHQGGRSEVPSASALRKFNATSVNMWMYHKLLERAIEKGAKEFDFGRSSVGSGTFKFKEQWGAKPHSAVWQYYVRKGDPAEMRPDSEGKKRLVRIWQKIPVGVTRWIGPTIVRGIP